MPALQLMPVATTACSPSPKIGILCSASSRPLPKPFRSPGPPSPYTQISKHQSATLPPPAHCSHLRPSFGPHMEPSHFWAGIRGRCLLPQARCLVGPALTPHLTCLGVIALGSLPWVHYLGVVTLGSLPWDRYLGFKRMARGGKAWGSSVLPSDLCIAQGPKYPP